MKTILSFLFCCFIANNTMAQTAPPNYQYIPMVVENAHWTVRVTIRGPQQYYDIHYADYILKGDTTIGIHTYKKLYNCPNLVAGLREDVTTQKVYVYIFSFC